MSCRARSDSGTGLLGSFAALMVFLVLLLFATQLLLALYTRSTVTSAAYESARVAARGSVDHTNAIAVAGARARGEQRARVLLGRFGDRVSFDWSASTDDTTVLRVRATALRLALAGLSVPSQVTRIDRTVRVRVERLR